MRPQITRLLILFTNLLLVAIVYTPGAFAQTPQPQPTPLTAPPPLKTIGKDERLRLEQSDTKQRIRLTIELASAHLGVAEKHTEQGNYEAASVEVGIYQALIENALSFLNPLKRDSNKTRDLYKRLELALRSDGPRLTAMRRTTPLEFAVWIKKVEDFARDGRTEALNSFYGHTVVHETQTPEKDKSNDKPKESPTPKSDEP